MLSVILIIIIFIFLIILLKKSINFPNLIKKNKAILIVYLITVIILFTLLFNTPIFQKEISDKDYNDILNYSIILFLFTTQISLFIDIFIIVPIQKKHEKSIKEKYRKESGVKEIEYYRELVSKIPPAILAYCYNDKLNVEDVIVASLANLEKNNAIKIENNDIKVINKNYNFMPHEKFIIFEYLSTKYKTNKERNKDFIEVIKSDLKGNNYILDKNEEINIIEILNFFLLLTIFFGIGFFILSPLINKFRFIQIFSVFITYFLAFGNVIVYNTINKKINSFVKTNKGYKLDAELNGLKNYLKDFTSINEESIDKIKLYDEYIIYAIIFDLKGNLNNECKELYNYIKKIAN